MTELQNISLEELAAYAKEYDCSIEQAFEEIKSELQLAAQTEKDEVMKRMEATALEQIQTTQGKTLIERVVVKYLQTCLDEGKLPTNEETNTIIKLDLLNRSHNG